MSPRWLPLLAVAVTALAAAGAQAALIDLPPVSIAGVPATATAGAEVHLDARASRDPDGSVVDVLWDFGDGGPGAHGLEVDHRWASPGVYTVTARAVDDAGASGLPAVRVITVTKAFPAPTDLCARVPPGVRCQLGGGRHTAGGKREGKVSHRGWPRVTGVLWILDNAGRSGTGTRLNDELLGGHGNDRLVGGRGHDILWGDQWPTGNNTVQRDVLLGGEGNDWLYASHGPNVLVGGAGNDTIWSYFAVRVRIRAGDGNDRVWVKNGVGRVDCGPGRDVLHVPLAGYTSEGCEVIEHYCHFGDDGHGGCNHGPARAVRARR